MNLFQLPVNRPKDSSKLNLFKKKLFSSEVWTAFEYILWYDATFSIYWIIYWNKREISSLFFVCNVEVFAARQCNSLKSLCDWFIILVAAEKVSYYIYHRCSCILLNHDNTIHLWKEFSIRFWGQNTIDVLVWLLESIAMPFPSAMLLNQSKFKWDALNFQ